MNRRRSHAPNRWRATVEGGVERVRPLFLAVLVHGLAAGLLWIGSLNWQAPEPPPVPAFSLVDTQPYLERQAREAASEQAAQRAEQEARRLQQQQAEEEARQRALAEQRQREQEEQERQALLEREREAERQRQLEQQRQEEERRQLERERREAEERRQRELEELRRQREVAEAERREQERRLAELAERREQARREAEAAAEAERLRLGREQAERDARRATLREEYVATIAELVRRNWIRPATTRPGVECAVQVVQIPGGEIVDQALASPCNADEPTRRSIVAAVQRAGVLPYRGYEEVFEREIRFVFRYDGD